jgi:hypothetical protein
LDDTIEKKSFWFDPHAKKNSWNVFQEWISWHWSLDDSFETYHNKSFKKIQKHHKINLCLHGLLNITNHERDKDTINPTTVIHTKSLKKVWEIHTQYNESNIVIVDCPLERVKKNPK